jgi:lantibiotic modifying enzyme
LGYGKVINNTKEYTNKIFSSPGINTSLTSHNGLLSNLWMVATHDAPVSEKIWKNESERIRQWTNEYRDEK